jgi:hypothetical protein
MPQTVGGTGSALTIEAKILFVEYGLEEFALPLRKNQVSGRIHGIQISGIHPPNLATHPVMDVDRKAIPVLAFILGARA